MPRPRSVTPWYFSQAAPRSTTRSLRNQGLEDRALVHPGHAADGPDAVAFHESGGGPIPFGTTGVALRPLYHMSAFLWTGVPVFDIRAASGQMTDMLVRTPALGRALAQTLAARAVALLRGHVVGVSLPEVVFRWPSCSARRRSWRRSHAARRVHDGPI